MVDSYHLQGILVSYYIPIALLPQKFVPMPLLMYYRREVPEHVLIIFAHDHRPEAQVQWKCVVQELVMRERQVESNWKERLCGLSDHQPDDCRVLCCVSYCEGAIFSW